LPNVHDKQTHSFAQSAVLQLVNEMTAGCTFFKLLSVIIQFISPGANFLFQLFEDGGPCWNGAVFFLLQHKRSNEIQHLNEQLQILWIENCWAVLLRHNTIFLFILYQVNSSSRVSI